MFPRVTGVRHLQDYRLEIGFSDGGVAKLDFRRRIGGRGGVFAALESLEFFMKLSRGPRGRHADLAQRCGFLSQRAQRRGHGKLKWRNVWQTARRWKRGLVAVAVASCLFFVCLLPGWPISYHAPRDQLIELAFYVIFSVLVYWLFSRPRSDSS